MYFQNQFWDEQKSFLWWKKRQRKKYLESALMILFLEVLAGTVCFYGQTETIELKDQIFGIAGLGIFGVAAIYLLIQWRKSAQWEMEWYEWGTVKEKTRYNSQGAVRRYDKKRYYIKVQTSERVIEGECEFETYKKVKSGEKVLILEINVRFCASETGGCGRGFPCPFPASR